MRLELRRGLRIGGLVAGLWGSGACLGPGTLNQAQCRDGGEVLLGSCVGCHSSALVDTQRSGAPVGVDFDTPDDTRRNAAAVRDAALVRQSMPPGVPLPACEQEALRAYLDAL